MILDLFEVQLLQTPANSPQLQRVVFLILSEMSIFDLRHEP
jgi:hypothetical protein